VSRRVLALAAALAVMPVFAAPAGAYTPGAPGAGDPYYPFAGNGGYDVSHYDLELTYDAARTPSWARPRSTPGPRRA
jgi:hypothetical protein